MYRVTNRIYDSIKTRKYVLTLKDLFFNYIILNSPPKNQRKNKENLKKLSLIQRYL